MKKNIIKPILIGLLSVLCLTSCATNKTKVTEENFENKMVRIEYLTPQDYVRVKGADNDYYLKIQNAEGTVLFSDAVQNDFQWFPQDSENYIMTLNYHEHEPILRIVTLTKLIKR